MSAPATGSGDDAVSLAAALEIIGHRFVPVAGVETAAYGTWRSRILAADVVAPIAVPPADNSAVDGYAVRHADLAPDGETRLRIAGRAAAGHPVTARLGRGEAVRIMTGAVMPDGADTVAMQERVRLEAGSVVIPAGLAAGDNRRRAGEDIEAGRCLLSRGRRLGAAEIGLLASVGVVELPVRTSLKIAVFSSGDELIDPGAPLGRGQLYDSNRPALLALLEAWGLKAADLGILPDRRDTIRTVLAAAASSYDAVLCSGGMSVGDEDHVRLAVESLGALDFWNIAIKPGRPIAVGRIGSVPFFGLPGNPAAMMVTFLMIVQPALLGLAGAAIVPPRRFPVIADFALQRKPGRREFLRATLHDGLDGRLLARPFPRGGSGILSSIALSDGLLDLDETLCGIAPGAVLPFLPFGGLGL